MTDKKLYNETEKFKVLEIHTDGLFGNDIDIETKNKQKYQIATDKEIKPTKNLIGEYIELKYTKDDKRYYFPYIDYKIG